MFLKSKKIAVFASVAILFFSACQYEKLQPFGIGCNSEVSYVNDIVPVINANCMGCHYAGNGTIGNFATYAGLKTDNGTLNSRVLVLKDMPQGGSMSDENRQKINCWIKQGALNN